MRRERRPARRLPALRYLWNKLTCAGTQMPKTGASLSPQQLDTVQAWIASGAGP